MMKRLLCFVMIGASLAALLVGCGPKPEEAKMPSGSEYQPTTKLRTPKQGMAPGN